MNSKDPSYKFTIWDCSDKKNCAQVTRRYAVLVSRADQPSFNSILSGANKFVGLLEKDESDVAILVWEYENYKDQDLPVLVFWFTKSESDTLASTYAWLKFVVREKHSFALNPDIQIPLWRIKTNRREQTSKKNHIFKENEILSGVGKGRNFRELQSVVFEFEDHRIPNRAGEPVVDPLRLSPKDSSSLSTRQDRASLISQRDQISPRQNVGLGFVDHRIPAVPDQADDPPRPYEVSPRVGSTIEDRRTNRASLNSSRDHVSPRQDVGLSNSPLFQGPNLSASTKSRSHETNNLSSLGRRESSWQQISIEKRGQQLEEQRGVGDNQFSTEECVTIQEIVQHLPQLEGSVYAYSNRFYLDENQNRKSRRSVNLITESGSMIFGVDEEPVESQPKTQSDLLKDFLKNPGSVRDKRDFSPLYVQYVDIKAKLQREGFKQEYIHWRNSDHKAAIALVNYLIDDCGLPKTRRKATLSQCQAYLDISVILYLKDNTFVEGKQIQEKSEDNLLFPLKKTIGFIAFARQNHANQIIAFHTKERNHTLRNVMWLEAILAHDESAAFVKADTPKKGSVRSRAETFYTKFGFRLENEKYEISLKNENDRLSCSKLMEYSLRGDAKFVPGLQRKGPPAREFTKDGKRHEKYYCGKYPSDAWRLAEGDEEPYFAIVDDPTDIRSYPDNPWRKNGDKFQCFQQGTSFGAHLGKRTFA